MSKQVTNENVRVGEEVSIMDMFGDFTGVSGVVDSINFVTGVCSGIRSKVYTIKVNVVHGTAVTPYLMKLQGNANLLMSGTFRNLRKF